jgi:uncharacterized protein
MHGRIKALLGALFGDVPARPLEHGRAAYKRGDYATAMHFLRPLAERGNADAQALVGGMYDNGLGVPRDDAQTIFWYGKAAEQGDARAQYNLGVMWPVTFLQNRAAFEAACDADRAQV